MGNRYVVKRDSFTPASPNDALTLISAASRRLRIVQIAIAGLGSSAAAQALLAARSAAGTTPGGAIVPSKFDHTEEPTAAFTTATTWSSQPTVETNGVQLGWNAQGGAIVWNAPKGGGIEARNGECVSIRAISGPTYQACTLSVIVEED